jgi:hypothetical protein
MRNHNKDFSHYSLLRKLSRWIWVGIGISIFSMILFFSQKHFVRYDLHGKRSSILSRELVTTLKELRSPVEIYVLLPSQDDELMQDVVYPVRRLLRECIAICPQFLKVHCVNASQLSAVLKTQMPGQSFNLENYSLWLLSNGSCRSLDGKKLYHLRAGGHLEFCGESELYFQLKALQTVLKKKIYFLTGHGEVSLRSTHMTRGLSWATSFLEKNCYLVEELNLTQGGEIPEDANAIVIAGALSPLLKAEVDRLENYLEDRAGRLLVCLAPLCPHGMEWLFFHRGIWVDPHLMADRNPEDRLPSNEIVVKRFADHEATKLVFQQGLGILMDCVQAVQPDIGAPLLDHQTVIPLLWSSDNAYLLEGETLRDGEEKITAQQVQESKFGLLPLGSLSERGSGSGLGVALDHGKMAVVGNVDAITNGHIQSLGNRYFLLGLMQYLLNDGTSPSLSSVEVSEYRLQMTRTQMQKCWKIFLMPIIGVLLLAWGVYLVRKDL